MNRYISMGDGSGTPPFTQGIGSGLSPPSFYGFGSVFPPISHGIGSGLTPIPYIPLKSFFTSI